MPGKESWRRRVAAMALTLMSLVSLSSPAQAAPAGSGSIHGKYAVAVPDPAAAEGVEPAHLNPQCGPADHVLVARSLGENVEQKDLLVNGVATERMPSARRVDAQVNDPAAASGEDYGIVRGPPGTHRCRG
ncbi:hypothetical protein Acsp02_90040 [Actinoplanes sp. NBRC 103695]|nr:hypothetical protein Acsp02_90040 [Actinoplanes sp. NBRC 103695]